MWSQCFQAAELPAELTKRLTATIRVRAVASRTFKRCCMKSGEFAGSQRNYFSDRWIPPASWNGGTSGDATTSKSSIVGGGGGIGGNGMGGVCSSA